MELSPEQRQWCQVLRIVLIDIRALEDDKLVRARDLANIMHNVPTALFADPEIWTREKKALKARAAHVGLGGYLDGLVEHCASKDVV